MAEHFEGQEGSVDIIALIQAQNATRKAEKEAIAEEKSPETMKFKVFDMLDANKAKIEKAIAESIKNSRTSINIWAHASSSILTDAEVLQEYQFTPTDVTVPIAEWLKKTYGLAVEVRVGKYSPDSITLVWGDDRKY